MRVKAQAYYDSGKARCYDNWTEPVKFGSGYILPVQLGARKVINQL